ncbi:MAG: magnesium chelatase [Acidimicrobiia bacterium]|nr:magnesium chelatase [Acidimicrobiia bacterium]
MPSQSLPATVGDLRQAMAAGRWSHASVKDELRTNLLARLRTGEPLVPGIVGYDDTVVPQIVNAILSKHNFILLGLRGQAKTRLLRALTSLLDPEVPVIAGCEIHDHPLKPICGACQMRVAAEGDTLPIAWRSRDQRYVEKLATPDVTIADLIGDIDPIKAAKSGLELGDVRTMHYGLLPRAHRGIFAINELPDLASKVQVGLFNILQEGDVQIKGYPVRLPLDVVLVFSANPEDYTARGKIITPLKDRIGSEIRTHYPRTREDAIRITAQEAWTDRPGAVPVEVPAFVREVIEEIAFQARQDSKVDRRSGVSQRLPITTIENVVSNAERRAAMNAETVAVPRVSDLYASLPALTGKIELEYEGELKGADSVARDLVRASIATVFDGYAAKVNLRQLIHWFDEGGTLDMADTVGADTLLDSVADITALHDALPHLRIPIGASAGARASLVDFVLEGLCATKKISRTDEGKLEGSPQERRPKRERAEDPDIRTMLEDDAETEGRPKGRKKYYN